MAYTAPDKTAFKARFPKLSFTDPQIDAMLAEVVVTVDDSWTEADYANAILYLTAHMLVQEDNSYEDPAHKTNENLGAGMSTSFAAPQDDDEGLLATEYGRRYVSLRDRNFPGILAV